MKRAGRVGAVLAALAVAAAMAIVPLSVSSSAATVPLLGSYNGAANPSGSASFAAETGTTASLYSDYAAGENETWTNWNNTIAWLIPQLKGKLGSSRLELSVPLASGGYSSQSAAMAAFAANPATFDANMTGLAQTLVANGFSNTIIRLMWEPQELGLYSNDDLTSAANYAALFRDAHTAMASVSGANFQWAWYWEANFDSTTNNTAYPGSAYVDYITNDFYDQSWVSTCGIAYNGTAFSATQENCLWSAINGYAATLKTLTTFAANANKPIGIGEWGVINRSDNHGGNDDPTFIANYTAWMKSNNVAWASYFNFNDGGGLDSTLSHFPNSLAAYKADLAGSGGSPPVTTTTTTTQPQGTTTTTTQPHSTTTTTQPQGGTTTTTTAPPSGVVVTRVAPSSGSTLGGTTVTITGSGFSGASAVDFGTVPATIGSVSATAITVTAPPSAGGTVDVTVAASLGRSQPTATDHFVYVSPTPIVSSVSPSAGTPSGGTAVIITGNGFTGATKVSFGTAAASFSVNSNSSISATAPSAAAGSLVDVTVTGPGGTSAVVTADKFSYGAVVTSVSPHSGNHLGGTTVTINGSGFTGATAVSFGGVPITTAISVNSTGTQITVAAPAHAAGTVDVTVTVGGTTTATTALDEFTFI